MASILYGLGALAASGYWLNKDGRESQEKVQKKSIPENQKPSGQDIYNSRHYEKVWGEEFKKSTDLWKRSQDPVNTNIIPAAYKDRQDVTFGNFGGKIIQTEKSLRRAQKIPKEPSSSRSVKKVSHELLKTSEVIDFGTKSINDRRRRLQPVTEEHPEGKGGWNKIFTNATSSVRDSSSFPAISKRTVEHQFHNNMEPFFGGSVKQNMDPNVNRTRLEAFTGTNPTFAHKKEVERFFPTEKNPFVNGLPVQSNRELDRYIPSNLGLKTNQKPFEEIRVAPGLNQPADKLTSSIGFHDDFRPTFKSVNELRVNPKSNYKGRVVGKGAYVAKRTRAQPVVTRRQVDVGYTNDPNNRTRVYRQNLQDTHGGVQQQRDLNPNAIVLKHQERDLYGHEIGNYPGIGVGETKKQYTIPDIRVSNKPTYKRQIIAPKAETDGNRTYLFDDARVTVKQQLVGQNVTANVAGSSKYTSQTYNFDDARVTIKQQLVGKNVTANVNGSSKYNGQTYAFDDARVTIKEQLTGKNVTANVGGSSKYTNQTHFFDDARVTIKQQTQDAIHSHINTGSSDSFTPMNRQNAYNAEINALKELTIQGREPTQQGSKVIPDKSLYNVESKSIQYDTYDKTRRIGKVYAPPSTIKPAYTQQKQLYGDHGMNKDRINPDILTAFKSNPYTQSLSSHEHQYNPRAAY